jgi:hypothetical protein
MSTMGRRSGNMPLRQTPPLLQSQALLGVRIAAAKKVAEIFAIAGINIGGPQGVGSSSSRRALLSKIAVGREPGRAGI